MTPQQISDEKLSWLDKAHVLYANSDSRHIMLPLVKSLVEKQNWEIRKNTSETQDTFLFKNRDDKFRVVDKAMQK